jgi:hypothetical protein
VSLNLLDFSADLSTVTVITSLLARGVVVTAWPQRELRVAGVPPVWVVLTNTVSSFPFSISDNGPANDPPYVWATSSNPNLVPSSNLTLSNSPPLGQILTLIPSRNQAGDTTVTLFATNKAGLKASATSSVTVTVLHPLEITGGGGATPPLGTWGNALWFVQTNVAHDGLPAAQSGAVGNGQQASIQTTVVGPGTLSFWWKVSSETNCDLLTFHIDTSQLARISGEADWQQMVFPVSSGSHTLRWDYSKDLDGSSGMDAGWVAQIAFLPSNWLQISGAPTNGQCRLDLYVDPGRIYEVLASTNLLDWFPLSLVQATNRVMPFIDTTAGTNARFYRLRDVSIWFGQSSQGADGSVRLALHSPPGLQCTIEVSTNLVDWISLATVSSVSGQVEYTELAATNFSARFFRAALLH